MVFGKPIKSIKTKSGHYTLPTTRYTTLLNNVNSAINTHVILIAIVKLRRQIAHPPPERIVKLLNSAGEEWKNDSELKSLIRKSVTIGEHVKYT